MSLQLKFRRVHGSFAIVFVAITIFVSSYFLFSPMLIKATEPSWVSSIDPVFEKQEIPSEPTILNCDPVTKILEGVGAKDVCLTRGKHLNFARYYEPAEGVRNYISFGGESKMYRIKGLPSSSYVYLLENTDSIVMRWFSSGSAPHPGSSLLKYDSLPEHLVRKTDDGIYYQFNNADPDFRLKKEDGSPLSITTLRTSNNGKWLIARTASNAFIRIDSSTNAAKVIDRIRFAQPNADPDLGISNDGRYLVLGGYASPFYMYDTVGGCGDPINHLIDADDQPLANPCTKKDYTQFEKQQLGGGLDRFHSPYFTFNDDATSLEFHTFKTSNTYIDTLVTLTMPGYTPPPGLDYLALGDSYSSGEGDTETDSFGKKYYRPWTNMEENQAAGQPREKCHISTRSYPYLLAQSMDLAMNDPKQWDSVACSGAMISDVIPEDKDSDQGQNNRLSGFGNQGILKTQALNEIIPGRVKQVEFVRKYKPKVITLTMGGNDAQFGTIITSCVNPDSIFTGGEWAKTCSYAKDDDKKVYLFNQIRKQYTLLKQLYKELYNASGKQAKIYVLAYPQIVNETTDDAACDLNVRLNKAERQMVKEAYSYMNSIVEAAARSVGVKYVDIESSFNGHRLCDSEEKYVTGTAAWNSSEIQESFHPNASGHRKITSSFVAQLSGQSPLNYQICMSGNICPDSTATEPPIPPYFQAALQSGGVLDTIYGTILKTGDTIDKLTSANIWSPEFYFSPNSPLHILMYSDPTDLGVVTTTNAGQLDASIAIPSTIPAGYHTLVVTGKSYSGEDKTVWQIVKVQGSDPSDRDENNIPDSQQVCGLFTLSANIDHDQDGTDDACDPQITEPPTPQDPYRMRAGNPTRTYAGQPEAPAALYLERNVNAATKTGVTGDYDPDQDGWVVIATNHGSASGQPPLTPYARFWTDGTDGSVMPHISFRTKENGCVQYKPTNLSQLTATNSMTARVFSQETADTSTCRSEPPEADTDNNGIPDSAQPLYLARRGDSTKAEDPTKLYLFRSTRAAEAQLGKSDYAANAISPISSTDIVDRRQEWSLLATSPANTYSFMNNFAKLRFVNNYPYVLTGYTSQFYTNCTAYKPQNIDTIRQSTQATRQLQADWMTGLLLTLQGGCNG